MKTRTMMPIAACLVAALLASPVAAASPSAAKDPGALGVSFGAAPFYTTAAAQVVDAVPFNQGPALGGGFPAHVQVTFDGQAMPEYFAPSLSQLRVVPASEFRGLESYVGQEIDQLQGLIASKPGEVTRTLPLLPPLGASQVFHAQDKYVDTANGSGIRYISEYAQDVHPITNQDVFYTFQGLTGDGQYYIMFFYPISTTALPATIEDTDAAKDYDAFARNYESYLTETVKALNAAAPADFRPSLDELDQWVKTIDVTAAISKTLAGKSYASVKTSTKVIKYAPTTRTLPTETKKGSCFANAISAPRLDAWRCTTEDNMMSDPCFAWKGKVVCDVDPRQPGSGYVMQLTEKLPKANVPAAVRKEGAKSGWLFELTYGTVCSPMNGATGAVDDKRMNYGCEGGFVILGDLKIGKVWTADKVLVKSEGDGKFSITESYPVVIRRIWQ